MRVKYEEMVSEFKRVLEKYGFEGTRAEEAAEIFAQNSLAGVYSHGLNRFPRVVEYLKKGEIDPNIQAECTFRFGAFERWNGHRGFGPLNARQAMKRAVELAKESGIGIVALGNNNHWMRGGTYGWQAADEGCIGIWNPIGSGRYVLKQWDKGQQVIFEANPDYYGEAPKMKKVTVLFMEEDAAYAAVLSGQADLAYTAASYAGSPVEGYRLLDCETVDNRGINLPAVPRQTLENGQEVGNDLTCDVNVRRAMNLAIDRETLIANVLDGYGTPAYSVCDKMPWYYEGSKVETDLDKAKALMEEAGWTEGSDGIREKDGKKAILTIGYPSEDSVRQAMAAETANQLKNLGIDASTKGLSWDEAYTFAYTEPLMWGWGAHTPVDLWSWEN